MPKTWPLCTGAELNFRDRVLGEVEKNSFIALPGKGGYRRLVASKPREFGEEFYSSGSGAGLLIRIRVCAGPVFLSSVLRWFPDELLWFSRLSNCDFLSGMKNASSSS